MFLSSEICFVFTHYHGEVKSLECGLFKKERLYFLFKVYQP